MSFPYLRTNPIWRVRLLAVVRLVRCSFLIAVALLFTGSLLTFLSATPHTFADELAPETPGSIAGVIQNAQGEPQSNLEVTLYRQHSALPSTFYPIRTNKTGVDGAYRFALLSVGKYRIGERDPQQIYAPLYYPAAPSISEATDISVLGNQLTDIDMTVQLGGQITGVVANTSEISITQISMLLLQEMGEPNRGYWDVVQTITISDTGGGYAFTGLNAGIYRTCAYGYSSTFAIYECYGNVYAVERATDLIVTTGATISNVNLILGNGADYPRISGRVVSTSNEPLTNIEIYATMFNVPPPSPLQTISMLPMATSIPISEEFGDRGSTSQDSRPRGNFVARTNSQGNYHISTLPEGRYFLFFFDPTERYATKYYNDTYLLGEATALDIVPHQIITNVNAQLETAGHLAGKITIFGEPAAAAIIVEQKTVWGWSVMSNSQADVTGHYAIGGLVTGIYRVSANHTLSSGYGTYYYKSYFGGATEETATEIALNSGETKLADIALVDGPQFAGSLSGQVTAAGTPLAGAKVSLYSAPSISLVDVVTDAEGRYAINGLTTSSLQVRATDPTGIYATTYYTAYRIASMATVVMIEDDQATTGINIDLPLGGAISGRVTQRNGAPVEGLVVTLYAPDVANSIDETNRPVMISNDTRTDAEGRYTITGLHAEDYYVCFSIYTNSEAECYGLLSFNFDNSDNGRVKVVAGATTKADLLWGPDHMVYLPFIKR